MAPPLKRRTEFKDGFGRPFFRRPAQAPTYPPAAIPQRNTKILVEIFVLLKI